MKTVFNGIMKNKWTKLTALVIAALWSGPTVQAQAPHPERIYLSGTGIDDTSFHKHLNYYCFALLLNKNNYDVNGAPKLFYEQPKFFANDKFHLISNTTTAL